MSANFYNSMGQMVGVDLHIYFTLPAIPVPVWHLVSIPNFGIWPGTLYKDTDTVSSDGWDMIQDGYDWYFIMHLPIALAPASALPPPSPKEPETLAGTILDSGSKPFLSVHSVTGEGTALATTIYGVFGLNVNCWAAGTSMPTGIVAQPNSVTTTPTLGDWAGAVAGLCADNIIGFLVDKIPVPTIKHILRRLPDLAPFLDVPGHLKSVVQKAVDGAL